MHSIDRWLPRGAVLLLVPAGVLLAAPRAAARTPGTEAGTCHALLLGGLPGTAVHARHYRDWIRRFRAYLIRTANVPAENIVVLTGDKGFKDSLVSGPAAAGSIEKALAEIAGSVRPRDQFILFMVGLGVTTEKVPTFVVPGPDINARRLARALAAIPAANQVVLNFSASSGDFTPYLSREGRVVVSANMPGQNVPPVYAEFFLRALTTKRADGEGAPDAGRKDGTVTVLEAYNWAAFQAAQWIARQHKAGENVWRVDGAESIEIFRKLYVSASGEPGSRRLHPDSDASRPDPIVRLKTRGGDDTEFAKSRRRVITEHAGLEDCGAEEPVSALGDEHKDYVPLAGKGEAEPGCLARRVVLGRAALLPMKGS